MINMVSVNEILAGFIGMPSNDIESTLLYLVSCCIGVLVIYFVILLFKVTVGIIRKL